MHPGLGAALSAVGPDRRDESLAFNAMGDNQQRLDDVGEGRLQVMDELGIDVAVLALTPPGTQTLPAEQAVALSRVANDRAAAVVGQYPDRFRALSSLPLSAPERVVDELERCAAQGHVGSMVYGR